MARDPVYQVQGPFRMLVHGILDRQPLTCSREQMEGATDRFLIDQPIGHVFVQDTRDQGLIGNPLFLRTTLQLLQNGFRDPNIHIARFADLLQAAFYHGSSAASQSQRMVR